MRKIGGRDRGLRIGQRGSLYVGIDLAVLVDEPERRLGLLGEVVKPDERKVDRVVLQATDGKRSAQIGNRFIGVEPFRRPVVDGRGQHCPRCPSRISSDQSISSSSKGCAK